jgi:hypothetical protein
MVKYTEWTTARSGTAVVRTQGLFQTTVGTFTQALDSAGKQKGWTVISMQHDRKGIFAFEQ